MMTIADCGLRIADFPDQTDQSDRTDRTDRHVFRLRIACPPHICGGEEEEANYLKEIED
jgi:hypothetical protein